METQIIELDTDGIQRRLDARAHMLADSVADGAAISFMAPLPYDEAARFWSQDVRAEVAAGRRVPFWGGA